MSVVMTMVSVGWKTSSEPTVITIDSSDSYVSFLKCLLYSASLSLVMMIFLLCVSDDGNVAVADSSTLIISFKLNVK